MSRVQTRPCPNCGALMGKNRGVCSDCGHMTTWFKIRLIVGGISVLLAIASLVGMSILAMMAQQANTGAP